jgi:glycosyltransferase
MTFKISIITVTYNASKYISHNLCSMANQSYKNIEHIIVDGLSNDDTIGILRKNNFNMNNVICERDEGIYHALNKGIMASTGDIVGILHSDDIFEDADVLKLIVDNFIDDSVQAVYGNLRYINKSNTKVIRNWKSNKFNESNLKNGWMPPHPTLFVRKKIIYPNYVYNEKLKISSDYQMILRLFSQKNFNAIYIDKYLVKMRIGGMSNKSLRSIILKMYEDFLVLKELNLTINERILCLIKKNLSKLNQFTFM